MAKGRSITRPASRAASGPTTWIERRVHLPRALYAMLGETPRLYELLTIGASGLAGAAISFLLGEIAAPEVLWKRTVVALLALDLSAGAVACSAASGAAFYAAKSWRRRLFIAVHVMHPALLAALFPDAALFFAVAGAYTLAAAFAVDALGAPEAARVASTALAATGVVLFSVIGSPGPLLVWFTPLYLLKLVVGFAARR